MTVGGGGPCGPECACGAPSRSAFVALSPTRTAGAAGTAAATHPIEQVSVPAGVFRMGDSSGDENPGDGETPVHEVELSAFEIDATPVTNDAFAAFVDATGYVTEAESFGFSAVFHLAVAADADDVLGRPPQTPWWVGVRGADWRHPGGRHSDITDLSDHPVVHVSHADAEAYCSWAARALPTEAQWEYAARGGLAAQKYPWGQAEPGIEGWAVNIWQGDFPSVNTQLDGYLTTAPVRTFAPNGYGLWQAVGNVWEWCADWFDPAYYAASPRAHPTGPATGATRVLRGGSYLCHDSYCNRYRNSARSHNTPDSSMGNAGFRTVSAR
ncbi:formylglycine-generating enzyme family protein [Microbacterium sp. 1.5R]|uniref:formylglycine-generating enzyme family protein n=1 Tax=Microbacterium sp. 1.5R TaxID=1916917 RepID=UPI0016427CF9|nr:formylglycine-generating enzyme family protein [Microbacterium sp. 1.5R]